MSASEVYQRIKKMIQRDMDKRVDESSLERLALYVTGLIKARGGSPAQAAKGLNQLKLREASAESLERRIRRMENDPEITAEYCFHPMARRHLALRHPDGILLILDPTTQEDRLVMVSINLWYRGRALPLVWTIWPGNVPLEGAGFWERIAGLLDQVAELIPPNMPVTLVADRAFGTPAFTDLVQAHGWHWVVRVQDQTVYQNRIGQTGQIGNLVRFRGQRRKLRGQAFKKAGWREVSIVVYWGRRHKKPLCLVSDLKPCWSLIQLYRRRFPIEGAFRDYKSHGWRWEQGQVKDLSHMQHLLVGMAVATWITLMAGTWYAAQLLSQTPTGRRYTRPESAKLSLFSHGLERLEEWLTVLPLPAFSWQLSDWNAPNWSSQIYFHHARAFVLA